MRSLKQLEAILLKNTCFWGGDIKDYLHQQTQELASRSRREDFGQFHKVAPVQHRLFNHSQQA